MPQTLKSMTKCPHCNVKDCVPWVVYANTENYGNRTHIAKCTACKRKIQISCHRTVKIEEIIKTDKACDWPDSVMEN